MEVHDIPTLNAVLNGIATVLIAVGYGFIRARRVTAHRICMTSGFIVSVAFLVGYVTHKILMRGINTPFEGTGLIRPIYYTMLISHIILAAVIVPLVLRTFLLALRGDFVRHRAWARWTFPMWFYVSVTGVLIYFFLYVWYPGTPPVPA